MSQITFNDFSLPAPLSQALADMGYETPTPVQAQAIPLALEGRDLLATAQTGTGKTAAFAIPLLTRMLTGHKKPALILAPTRELAEQTHKVLQQLTAKAPQLKSAVIIGGSSYHYQIRALRARPAFVVATPGRLIDQISLGNLNLGGFGALILDEADRMLDMGFEPQLEEIMSKLPADRQTMLFSATLPEEILGMAKRYLNNPERIAVGEVSKPVDRIAQQVIKTSQSNKAETLIKEIDKVAGTLIVFTRTKSRTEAVAKILSNAGHEVARIHGDRSQAQRREAIEGFRQGRYRILVATDIAARGIDVPHIRHVVNYDLPICPEDYIHRIGRTARAGAEGNALAFVTPEEQRLWGRIHKLMYGRFPEGAERPARFGGGRGGFSGGRGFGNRGGFGGRDFGRGGFGAKRDFGPRRDSRRPFGARDEESSGFQPRAQKSFRPKFDEPRAERPRSEGPRETAANTFGSSASSTDQTMNRAQRRALKFGTPMPAPSAAPKEQRAPRPEAFGERPERQERPAKKSFDRKPRFERDSERGSDRGFGRDAGFGPRRPRKEFGARTEGGFGRKPRFDDGGERPARKPFGSKPRFEKDGFGMPSRGGKRFGNDEGQGRPQAARGGFGKPRPGASAKGPRTGFGGRPGGASKGPQKRGGITRFMDRFRD